MDSRMQRWLHDEGLMAKEGEIEPPYAQVARDQRNSRPLNREQVLGLPHPNPESLPPVRQFDMSYQAHFNDKPAADWQRWFTLKRAAILAFIFPGFVGVFGPLMILIPLVYFGVALYLTQQKKERTEKVNDYYDAQEEQAKSDFKAQVKAYWATRPSQIIISSPDPLTAARGVLTEQKGILYLGEYPDTHEWQVLPKGKPVLIIGDTGVGKTSGMLDQNILLHAGPVVATSTREETLLNTYRSRSTSGRVWVYDPARRMTSIPSGVRRATYSPLYGCRSWDSAMLIAHSMVAALDNMKDTKNGGFFTSSAEDILAPLLHAAALHQDCSMIDVRRWIKFSSFDVAREILKAVARDNSNPRRVGAALALEDLEGSINSSSETLQNIMSTAKTLMKVYKMEAVQKDITSQNFDTEAFVRSNDTLYIATESEYQELTSPLFVAFISEIVAATKELHKQEPFQTSARSGTLLALDEAANIAPLPKLPKYVSEGGQAGVQTMLCVQNMPQAKSVWGDEAMGFMGLTVVAFGGITDKDTLDALSVVTGNYDRIYTSNNASYSRGSSSGSNSGHSGFSYQSGVNSGMSDSASNGTSTALNIVRQLTPEDISSLPMGLALTIKNRVWQIVELASVREEPWATIIASAPAALPEVADAPPLFDPALVSLRPVSEMLMDLAKERAAKRAASAPPAKPPVAKTAAKIVKLTPKPPSLN